MREHLPKIVIVLLLAVVVGLPFVLRPLAAQPAVAPGPVSGRLIIFSPHNEQIRYETSVAFNAWRMEQGLDAVEFDWRSSGGTSDLRKQILSQFEARADDGAVDQGIGADLFFGGGEYDHGKLAQGITHSRDWTATVGADEEALDLNVVAPMHSVLTLTLTGPIREGRVDFADDSVPYQPGEEVAQLIGKGTLGVAEVTTRVAEAEGGDRTLTLTLRNATGRAHTIDRLVLGAAAEPRTLQVAVKQNIPVSVPIPLGPDLLAEAFPTPTIGGEKLYDPDLYWVGVVLSSFGIVYNNDVLETLGVPAPQTWADLTDPRLMGWIALADPGHSGSIAATYNTILRRNGWTDGWRLLREAFANARYFASGASKVPVDVSAGEAAVGMCIDFYGRFQAGAIGGNRVGYVDPPGATAITADPITLIRGAPHDQLALQFIEWLLSHSAQTLWQARVGTPGGPQQFELRRQPIRRDMYTAERKTYWADPQIAPFEQARPLPAGMPDLFGFVAPISHAMAIDLHAELQDAWAAIQATPAGSKRDAMLERFHAMPEELTIQWPEALAGTWREALMNDQHPQHVAAMKVMQEFIGGIKQFTRGDAALEARLRWMLFFRENYRAVQDMAD